MEVNCVICYDTFLQAPATVKTEPEASSSWLPANNHVDCSVDSENPNRLWQIFCKYMNVEAAYQWLELPFCRRCTVVIEALSQLDAELESIRNRTAKIATECAASILQTFDRSMSDSETGERNRVVHEIRKKIFNQYNPQVELVAPVEPTHTEGDLVSCKPQSSTMMIMIEQPTVRLTPLLADSYSQLMGGQERAFPGIKLETTTTYVDQNSSFSDDIDPLDLADSASELFPDELFDCADIMSGDGQEDEEESTANPYLGRILARSEYTCSKCPPGKTKPFKTRQALRGHMERYHGGGIDCPHCSTHLSCKSAYYRHIRMVHEKSQKYKGRKARKTVPVGEGNSSTSISNTAKSVHDPLVSHSNTVNNGSQQNTACRNMKISPEMKELKVTLKPEDICQHSTIVNSTQQNTACHNVKISQEMKELKVTLKPEDICQLPQAKLSSSTSTSS